MRTVACAPGAAEAGMLPPFCISCFSTAKRTVPEIVKTIVNKKIFKILCMSVSPLK
jgi:hypothetical protein